MQDKFEGVLIIRTPGSLNLTLETFKYIGYKPVNLSDFEMNRGVQHVDKSLIVSNKTAGFLYVFVLKYIYILTRFCSGASGANKPFSKI